MKGKLFVAWLVLAGMVGWIMADATEFNIFDSVMTLRDKNQRIHISQLQEKIEQLEEEKKCEGENFCSCGGEMYPWEHTNRISVFNADKPDAPHPMYFNNVYKRTCSVCNLEEIKTIQEG